MVDCLHFSHFDEPHSDGLGCSLQDPLPVIFCLVKDLWEQTSSEGNLKLPAYHLGKKH